MNKEIIEKFGLQESKEVWGYSFQLDIPVYTDIDGNRFSMYNPHTCERCSYITIYLQELKKFIFVTDEMALDPYFKNIKMLYDFIKR